MPTLTTPDHHERMRSKGALSRRYLVPVLSLTGRRPSSMLPPESEREVPSPEVPEKKNIG